MYNISLLINKIVKKNFILCLFLLISIQIYSVDKIDDLSFTNTDITQVLKTISEIFGVTIVPDKDVQGYVTRYFKDTTLAQTLVLLLEPLGYIYEIKESIYFVTKKPLFDIQYDEQKKLFNINSKRASLQDIISEMSIVSKETIIFEGISEDLVSIHIFNKNIFETLKLLADSSNYEFKKEENSYYVKKIESEGEFLDPGSKKAKRIFIKGEENNIQIKLRNKNSMDIIIALFNKYKKKLSLLSKKSIKIPYLNVSNIAFDELLNIVFQHSGQAYTLTNGTYYIYDSLSSKRTNPYNVIKSYKLINLDRTNFSSNVPSQLIPQTCYKLDAVNNVVVIFGSPGEVEFYENFIRKVDLNYSQYKYRFFNLKNIDVKQVKKYLPDKYKKLKISIIEEQNMFTALLDEHDYKNLSEYLKQIDARSTKHKYKFKYLDPEEVLKSMLPKKIKKDQVVLNVNDSSLIFNISEEVKEDLFPYFDSIDLPTPVIRYQLLIVEYIHQNNFKWDWGVGFKKGNVDFNAEAGIFNQTDTINANFDIPTVFGYHFSAFLEYKLVENKAKIQMSTEVFGLSGETVTITNTQTLQYKDYITDNDTNEQTPVYSQTTFGLNLEIKGRATSSDEIYLEVSARISDELPGKAEGDAPDTSEKSVKNSIRTKTGKPIILGGLTSQKETSSNKKFPGFAHIPVLGNLFKTHNNSYTDSEFVIYIIPFVQKSIEDIKRERRQYIKKIYEYFVKR